MIKLDRSFWPAWLALGAVVAVFELAPLDLWLQDRFYDFEAQQWSVDGKAPVPRLVFYNGPKALLIALGVGLLGLALGPARWRGNVERRAVWVAFATLATLPILIGQAKATTNVFCPSEIRRYGGDVPYVRVFERYSSDDRPTRRGRGFPAGHASGGFALFGLVGLARTRRGQLLGIGTALATGWWMGGYQMAKGAHYLSHTLVTMLLGWLVFLAWRKVCSRWMPQEN